MMLIIDLNLVALHQVVMLKKLSLDMGIEERNHKLVMLEDVNNTF